MIESFLENRYLIMEALNFGLAFVMLVMVLKYRKKGVK